MPVQKAKNSEPGTLPTFSREPAILNQTVILQTFVPADNSIEAGQAVLYFDPTNGLGS